MLALPLLAAGPVEIEPTPGTDPEVLRIVNGLISSDYPTVGVILEGTQDNNYMFCTGTLIGCNTFLTAAHCLCANLAYCDDHDVSTGFVYFPNGGVYGISAVHIHPDFVFPVADVAVVTLSEPVTGITPSKINDVGPVPYDTRGTVVGYGLSERGVNGVKRSGKVTTEGCTFPISNDDSVCWRYMAPLGEPGEDSSICFGDSGGPLFVDMAPAGSGQSNVVVAGSPRAATTAARPFPRRR